MTVAELINKLSSLDPCLVVYYGRHYGIFNSVSEETILVGVEGRPEKIVYLEYIEEQHDNSAP